jgi:hypothetical protein
VRVFRPSIAVWSRMIALVAALFVAINVGTGALQALNPDFDYVHDRLPVHVLFLVSGLGYLLFLRKALFLSLAAGCEIRANHTGIDVRMQDRAGRFGWDDVERIQPGEIHLTVRAGGQVFAVPFIPRSEQRELFHLHFEQRGLSQNRMPMTTFPLRRRGW